MADYSLRSGVSLVTPPKQHSADPRSVGSEDRVKAQLRILRLESRGIRRSLPGHQTRAERQHASAEGTRAKAERKKTKSSKTKAASMASSKGAGRLVPATDDERVTRLELAILHVFTNKQLALDALDLRYNLENNQSSSWRLAVIGDFLLLLAPADKWIKTDLTTGESAMILSMVVR